MWRSTARAASRRDEPGPRAARLALVLMIVSLLPFALVAMLSAFAGFLAAQEPALADLEAAVRASTLEGRARFEHFEPAFRALEERARGRPDGLRAALWLLDGARHEPGRRPRQGLPLDRFLPLLDAYHALPELGEIADRALLLREVDRAAFLEAVAARSPHEAVQARALFVLGRSEMQSRDEELRERGAERLDDVYERFGTVKRGSRTFGDLAAAYLAPHAASELAVGQVAPEIAGETAAGAPLALSSFRGKVVLLVFWGHW